MDNNQQNRNWQCTYCDNFNENDVDDCLTCGGQNENNEAPEIKPQLNPVLDDWKCDLCTHLNLYSNNRCLACNGKSPYGDQWTCARCTMINDNTNDNCTTCFHLSPFIKPCPQCQANVKGNEKCKRCEEIARGKAAYVQRKPHGESWDCTKCSFKNPFNVNICVICNNVGPLRDSWQCDQCTFINEDLFDNCAICGIVRRKNILGNFIKPVKDNSVCRRCRSMLQDGELELCFECQKDYYICQIDDCGMMVESIKFRCPKCNARNERNVDRNIEPPERGWLCPWTQCRHFNDENNFMCQECCCYRDLEANKIKCVNCGWIHFMSKACVKCGFGP